MTWRRTSIGNSARSGAIVSKVEMLHHDGLRRLSGRVRMKVKEATKAEAHQQRGVTCLAEIKLGARRQRFMRVTT